MKRGNLFKRLLSLCVVIAMLLVYAVPVYAVDNGAAVRFEQVDNSVISNPYTGRESVGLQGNTLTYDDDDIVRVSIVLSQDSTLEAGYSTENIAANTAAVKYRGKLEQAQQTVTKRINAALGKELDVAWNLTLVANIISANVAYGDIETIKAVKGVEDVVLEVQYEPAQASEGTLQPDKAVSVGMNGVATAWQSGYTGAGMRIAIIDTGLDLDHQSFDNNAFLYALEETAAAAGKTFEDYDLLDAEEISGVLSQLNASLMTDGQLTAEDVSYNEKIPFTFNYIDINTNVTHLYDSQGEHGSHVAGIAASNRYIPDGDGYVEALQSVYVAGNAPDAQVLVMKVFGENGGAYDSDYMAAIEDAITLGCDAVNLSLGSSVAGMTTSATYQELLDSLASTDTVVTISSGNAYSWSTFTNYSVLGYPNYLYSDDVNFHTGGSPGTYANAFTVASVDNQGMVSEYVTVGGQDFAYYETSDYTSYYPLYYLALAEAVTLDYVLVDGIGQESDYTDVDLTGKVVICKRGVGGEVREDGSQFGSFYEKANVAASKGAAAVVIYNNVAGLLSSISLDGYEYTAPVVTITLSDAEAIKALSTQQTTESGTVYYSGSITIPVAGTLKPISQPTDYYTMSDFSSWGVPGDLSIKPEITANGGNIYSVAGTNYYNGQYYGGTDQYELMSGTSMAAPQVAGLVAQLKQYIEENGLSQEGLTDRALAQSLLMSTANAMYDMNGNIYPVIQQGAGLANIADAIGAATYILMDENATESAADGKVKAELGDDPDKDGKYSFSFSLNNLTGEDQNYTLDADVFTQGVFADYGAAVDGQAGFLGWTPMYYLDNATTLLGADVVFTVDGQVIANPDVSSDYDFNADGYVTRADAQLLMDYLIKGAELLANQDHTDVDNDGDTDTHDVQVLLTLVKSQTVTVPADGSLTVEVTIELSEDSKTFLDTYTPNGAYVEAYVYVDAVADEEGMVSASHSIPVLAFYGNWTDASMFDKGSALDYAYGNEYRIPYMYSDNGVWGNAFVVNYGSGSYVFGGNPVDYETNYLEQRNALNSNSVLEGVQYSLIRNAGYIQAVVYNSETGEIYAGQAYNGEYAAYFSMSNASWNYTISSIDLNWNGTDAEGNVLPDGTKVTVALTAVPEYYINGDEIDFEALGDGATYSIQLTIDNEAPKVVGAAGNLKTEETSLNLTVEDNQYVAAAILYSSQGVYVDHVILEEETAGAQTNVTLGSGLTEDVYLLQVVDYANNVTTYRVFVGCEETNVVESVSIYPTSLEMLAGQTATLTAQANPATLVDWGVVWSSGDEEVATVDANGTVTAVGEGTVVITAASVMDPTKSASCVINVTAIDADLNAVVWDENGEVWFSEFNTTGLPNYTKLHGESMNERFVAAAVGADGTLYASTLNTSTGTGALYTVDPNTYEVTKLNDCKVQGIDIFYSDLTYVPAMFGTGALLGSYGPFVIAIDPATGEGLAIIDQYDDYLVGITTCYGVYDPESGTYQDVVYVIERNGTVTQEIYYGYDGYVIPFIYAYYEERSTMDSGIDKGDAWYFNSAYYDGNYLFWAAFDQSSENAVTLYAIDADYSGNVYNLGQFADGVWPVSGLFQLSGTTSADSAEAAAELAEISAQAAEKGGIKMAEIKLETVEFEAFAEKFAADSAVSGGLNSVASGILPASAGDVVPGEAENSKQVVIEVTAQDLNGDVVSTNGLASVTYDPTAMTLVSVAVKGEVSSFVDQDGVVTFGYAALDAFAVGETVATLTFDVIDVAGSNVVVDHEEVNNDHLTDVTEEIGHTYDSIVTDPTCTEQGYTTDTCTDPDCGHSYVDSYVDALGHSYVDKVTPPTATEQGYTTHTCENCGDSYVDSFVAPDPNASANTGDGFSALWITLLTISACGAAALVITRKKWFVK